MEVNEKKNSILLGILGAVIGAAIATIPWILMYVYGEMILSLLAIIIAIGALKGYQLFKGKVTKQLPIIIAAVSLIMVIVATLVIIPLLLIGKEDLPMTWGNVMKLYEYDPFKEALLKDLAFSIVFTVLGISGVIANIKRQLSEGKTSKITATIRQEKKQAQIDEKKEEEALPSDEDKDEAK